MASAKEHQIVHVERGFPKSFGGIIFSSNQRKKSKISLRKNSISILNIEISIFKYIL